jgi:RecB family exonuclease
VIETSPGILPPVPELGPLGAISPSRFIGLQACALREVWSARRAPALLPTAPAARLGTVVHRLLEDAGRGRFVTATGAAVDARWDELIQASDHSAARSWLDRHLVPLSSAVPDFQVRKLRALAGARALADAAVPKPRSDHAKHHLLFGYEVAVATPDGQAGGRIDGVIPSKDGPIIRDYKSGAIYEVSDTHELAIKEAYSAQLKLYAAIYAAMTGTWPSRLELVPVGAKPEPVKFTVDESTSLLSTAVHLHDRINRIVESGTTATSKMVELAAPLPATCTHCPYRPNCMPYRDALASDDVSGWPSDFHGELLDVRTLGNGRRMVSLDCSGRTVLIRGLNPDPDRHPALGLSVTGDAIAVYNLRPAGSPTSFSEGPSTVFYKMQSAIATGGPKPAAPLRSPGCPSGS